MGDVITDRWSRFGSAISGFTVYYTNSGLSRDWSAVDEIGVLMGCGVLDDVYLISCLNRLTLVKGCCEVYGEVQINVFDN